MSGRSGLDGRVLPVPVVFTHSEVMMLGASCLETPCDTKVLWLGTQLEPTGRRAEVLGYGWFCCPACGVAMCLGPKDQIKSYPFKLEEPF